MPADFRSLHTRLYVEAIDAAEATVPTELPNPDCVDLCRPRGAAPGGEAN
jgi:hypothetical protein